MVRIRGSGSGSAPKCHRSPTLVRIRAFRDKFPACLLHVGRQDDQELHQEFILAAKGQSLFMIFMSVADPVCLSRSRIRIFSRPDPGSASKRLSILTQKLFLSSRKYDPGCSSRIRIPGTDFFLPIPDPGSRGQKCTWSRIRIRNTDFYPRLLEFHHATCPLMQNQITVGEVRTSK
jgi:hypothetical protein